MWYKVCSTLRMGQGLWTRGLGVVAAAGLTLFGVGCGHGGAGNQPKQPMGHVEVKHLDSPDDAPDGAKTVQVAYVFDKDIANKDFQKTFKDGFDKKGVKVDEQLDAKAHFEVTGAKITGTVTYVKKGMGRYSIIDADLVAEARYAADVQLDLDVKVKGDTKKMDANDWGGTALGGKPYPLVKNMMPVNIPIAGPLFLHAHFDLNAMCEIGVEGQMHATTGVGIKGDVRLSAKYKKAGFDASPEEQAAIASGKDDDDKKDDGKDDTAKKKRKFKFEAKAPNFELAPKPYLKVDGKQQNIKGSCSLQPTAVLLVENMVGASLIVEPWIELEAKRASSRQPWQLGAEAGVTVSAAPEVRVFGRKIGKKKEFELMEVTLAKMSGPELGGGGAPAPKALPAYDPPSSKPSKNDTQIAGLLNDGLGEKTPLPPTASTSESSSSAATAPSTTETPSSGAVATASSTSDSSSSSSDKEKDKETSDNKLADNSATPSSTSSSSSSSSSEAEDAPAPTPPKKKGGKALKALKAGLQRAKPVSRNPGLAGAAKKLLKKKR